MADSGVYDRWHRSRPAAGQARCREHDQVPTAEHGRGKRWQARWRDGAGRQRKLNFARKSDAEDRLDLVKADLLRGVYVDPAAGRTRVGPYARDWLKAQTFDETSREAVERRVDRLVDALGEYEVRAVRPSTVQAWVRGMQAEGRAPMTVRLTLGVLSSVMAAAVDDGLVAKNPCKSGTVRPPRSERRLIEAWPAERVAAVAAAMPEAFTGAVWAGYGLGLRQGEILGLAEEEVAFLRRQVTVRYQLRVVRRTLCFAPPKGGRVRRVPLSQETALRLAAHMEAHPPVPVTLPWKVPGGKPRTLRLLFTRDGGPVHRSTFANSIWTPALQRAGVPPAGSRRNGIHVLRHTFASTALANGVDIRSLAEWLGHADPAFTLRTYIHFMPSNEDRVRKAIDKAFRGLAEPVAVGPGT